MAIIAKHLLEYLQSKGLIVSGSFPSDHVAFPDGVIIGKPSSLAGNSIPDYESAFSGLDEENIEVNAPFVRLFGNHGKWFVYAIDYCPGPGPGDFINEWSTSEEAVNDILDFYFGDPARMKAKEDARRQPIYTLTDQGAKAQ